MIFTHDNDLTKGAKVAFMLKTRDGGRMFMFEGEVKNLDDGFAAIETPTGIKDIEISDVAWSGKRWELMQDDQREAPRKRGGVKRGR